MMLVIYSSVDVFFGIISGGRRGGCGGGVVHQLCHFSERKAQVFGVYGAMVEDRCRYLMIKNHNYQTSKFVQKILSYLVKFYSEFNLDLVQDLVQIMIRL